MEHPNCGREINAVSNVYFFCYVCLARVKRIACGCVCLRVFTSFPSRYKPGTYIRLPLTGDLLVDKKTQEKGMYRHAAAIAPFSLNVQL